MTELHRFYAERFLVSVHRDEVPAVAEACHTPGRLHTDRRLVALYRLLDALVDTMFPYLAAMDERIDELQDQIFVDPKESQLAGLVLAIAGINAWNRINAATRQITGQWVDQWISHPAGLAA